VLRAPGYEAADALVKAAQMVRTHAGELAVVVIEPLVQGAAGMQIASPGEFAQLADACRETGVLLICDEVATGFGRTGTLFASERCGLRPDIMCMGKGITGGYLPLSATAVNARVYNAFLGEDLGPKTLYHGHSYSGNALAAAVARRHLELIDEGLLTNVRARSDQLQALLDAEIVSTGRVKEVRMQGLMCGVELSPGIEKAGRRVCAASVRRGVLLRPLGDVVVIMPPLTITADEIERIVRTLREAIVEVYG
jgi:adenosylmethionine-8-amino-7-oxononanoate aminotransferase